MHYDLEEVRYIRNYTLWLRFSDGTQGEIDLTNQLFGEVFEPLKESNFFSKCFIHPELKVLSWPNGADLAPEFLYEAVRQAMAA